MMEKAAQRLLLRESSIAGCDDVHAYSCEMIKHMMFGPNTEQHIRDYLEKQCVQERNAVPRMHCNFAIRWKHSAM